MIPPYFRGSATPLTHDDVVETATEMEHAGGQVLALTGQAWEVISAAR